MKTFREWQEDIEEIAAPAPNKDGLDWHQFHRFRGDRYDAPEGLVAAMKSIVDRFRDKYEDPDQLIGAIIDSAIFLVRGDDVGSRTGSTLSLPGRFRRMGGQEREEV